MAPNLRGGAALLLPAFLFLALGGCSGTDDGAGASDTGSSASASSEGTSSVASSDSLSGEVGSAEGGSIGARTNWSSGQWFKLRVTTNDAAEPVEFTAVVVEERGPLWVVSADDLGVAKMASVPIYAMPFLGEIKKSNLAGAWDWYRFPLSEGMTWTARIAVPQIDRPAETFEYDVTFTATAAELATPLGSRSGFRIVGAVAGSAEPLLEIDYTPELGWFAHLTVRKIWTDGGDDTALNVETVATGQGWTGTYFMAKATPVYYVLSASGQPHADQASFSVGFGATYLHGFVFSTAWNGVHSTVLIDPSGNAREYRDVNQGGGSQPIPGQRGTLLDERVDAGPWRIAHGGCGAGCSGGAYLWQILQAPVEFK